MIKNVFSSILLSTLFYSIVLTTAFMMPVVLASHTNVGFSSVVTDANAAADNQMIWDRGAAGNGAGLPQNAVPANKKEVTRDTRMPGTGARSDSQARPAPVDRSGPDSEMIRAGKTRVKTIKV
ncbi:MAG TPA: hypothetical protein VHB46_11555 [Burkholderiales bacterium]|nr:hypothetical protein [Burkholderiales bacterium]